MQLLSTQTRQAVEAASQYGAERKLYPDGRAVKARPSG